MKNSILLLTILILVTSCASKSLSNSFYVENREDSNFSISTPAFLQIYLSQKMMLKSLKICLKKLDIIN